MPGVWAYNVGTWRGSGPSFQHVIRIGGLNDLMFELKLRPFLRGRVDHLGIVAHGDRGGVVQLAPPLTVFTVETMFRSHLEKLRLYLAQNAMLSFNSCVAAEGQDGTDLLNAVSRRLPGRTVIGFEVYGEIARDGIANTPGQIQERQQRLIPGGRRAFLTPTNMFAKWSRDGALVRHGLYGRDRQNHCGAPGCPGHAQARDHCEPPP